MANYKQKVYVLKEKEDDRGDFYCCIRGVFSSKRTAQAVMKKILNEKTEFIADEMGYSLDEVYSGCYEDSAYAHNDDDIYINWEIVEKTLIYKDTDDAGELNLP